MDERLGTTLFTLLLLSPTAGLSQGYSDAYNNYISYNSNYNSEDYYYDYEEGEKMQPTFLARSQTFTVEVGQSVIIPCDVENQGMNKLIIKKIPSLGGKEKLVSVGKEKVTRDRRLTVDGSRLTISPVRPRDAGTFLCTFETEEPVQLRHTLDVQMAPSVRSLAPPEQRVSRGATVTLECEAEGNPHPVIRWSRQEGPLPSGQRTLQGRSLTLTEVDRHAEGTYLCSADNGIGEAASAAMTLTVEYPPEVTTDKGIVRTGAGDRVELACVVTGQPVPDVFWTRDGHPLSPNNVDTKFYLVGRHNRSQDGPSGHLSPAPGPISVPLAPPGSTGAHVTHGATTHTQHLPHAAHRHILTIDRVSEKDFGAYVCVARNSHGHADAVIQMTGLPKPPQVTSSPNGGERNTYTLTWDTESYYPVTEFLVRYRRTNLGSWQANHTMVLPGAWRELSRTVEPLSLSTASPATVATDGLRHTLASTVAGLEAATDYEATVRVRNTYGWSAPSPVFSFSTKKVMAVLQSTSGTQPQLVPAPHSWLLALFITTFLAREQPAVI
ncbi:protein amalgam [Procambarus clarkii]|uniref:protein amalgam n=1 Tax=Procambarus clarkii TaxID=6728 RepID=UPI0037421435